MPVRRKPLQFYEEPLPGVDSSDLQGKLIVVEGPDAVGRTTQIQQLRFWLEQSGYAVVDTGMARSALTMKGIQDAKNGHTLGPLTMGLFYMTDFADRLENVVIPALRAGFVVLTDRYIYSLIARSVARGQDARWLSSVAGIALVPHATFYLRAEVSDLVTRVVCGPGNSTIGKAAWTCRMAKTVATASSNTRRGSSRFSTAWSSNTTSRSSTPARSRT